MRGHRLFLVLVLAVCLTGCAFAQPVPRVPAAASVTVPATAAPSPVHVRAKHPAVPDVARHDPRRSLTPRATPSSSGCDAAGRSTLVVDGRPVLRGVPARPARPPLVLAFAGYDQTRQDLDRVSHLVDRGRAQGVEVALLQGTGSTPAWGYQPGQTADVVFARHVLAALRPCVDPARLVLLGFSDGGLIGMRIGCALGPAVRHFVMLSASVAPESGCRLPGDVRAVHGTDDPFDPYGGDGRGIPPARSAVAAWAAAAGCARAADTTSAPRVQVRAYPPCAVSLTTLDGGGHAWPGGEPSANPHAGPVFHGYDLTAVLLHLAAA